MLGGSLFTLTLRGVLTSAGCSWVGDCSLSWGVGEWRWGEGDCICERDRGDWSWALAVWGPGDWSRGPPAGFADSSLPCLAPHGPLRPGSSWARASPSPAPPDIWGVGSEKAEVFDRRYRMRSYLVGLEGDEMGQWIAWWCKRKKKNADISRSRGSVTEWQTGNIRSKASKLQRDAACGLANSGDKVQENKPSAWFTTAVRLLSSRICRGKLLSQTLTVSNSLCNDCLGSNRIYWL